MTYKDQS